MTAEVRPPSIIKPPKAKKAATRKPRQPKLAVPTKKGRFYRHPNRPDVLYLSVTNALSVINKPALVGWAARTVAEEAMANLPSLIRNSRSPAKRAEAIDRLRGRPYAKRDAAADLGSRIHAAAEDHALEKPGAVDDDVRPFLEQYVRFRDDFQPEYEASEATVAHHDLLYAGTLDAIVVIGGRRLMVDYKTSSTRPVDSIYDEYLCQLAAYRYAQSLWLPDGSEEPVPQVDGCAVLNIRANDYALIEVDADEAAFEAFQAAIALSRWMSTRSDMDKPAAMRPLERKAS